MSAIERIIKRTGIVLGIALILPSAIFSDVQAKDRLYTIGIAMDDSTFSQELEGFKAGMTERGYVEGKNIKYISCGYIESGKDVDSKMKKVISSDVDMIFAMGNSSSAWANKTAAETDIKVLLAIENMPEDIDAIFRIPSLTLDLRDKGLSSAAIKKNLPMGSAILLDEAVLVTFTPDSYQAGRQTARLAHQIIQGAHPGDLPVETSEAMLIVNLRTAERVGVKISNDILAQAKTIIR